jgi:hypothetical protein
MQRFGGEDEKEREAVIEMSYHRELNKLYFECKIFDMNSFRLQNYETHKTVLKYFCHSRMPKDIRKHRDH